MLDDYMRIMAIIITADLETFQEISMTGREERRISQGIPVESTVIQDKATSKKS